MESYVIFRVLKICAKKKFLNLRIVQVEYSQKGFISVFAGLGKKKGYSHVSIKHTVRLIDILKNSKKYN